MKKLGILTICFFLINNNKLIAQVADTSAYLKEIVANKQAFIGKPFSAFEKILKIKIKFFTPFAEITYDLSKETSTFVGFIYPVSDEDYSLPGLVVQWQPYLDHKKADSLYNKDIIGGWDSEIETFYSKGIIKDITILP